MTGKTNFQLDTHTTNVRIQIFKCFVCTGCVFFRISHIRSNVLRLVACQSTIGRKLNDLGHDMLQVESSGSSSGRPVTSAKTRLYKNLAVLLLDAQFRLILTHLFINLATTYPCIHIIHFAIVRIYWIVL